jgi:hypothetical protein
MSHQSQAFYAVTCPECEIRTETDVPNEIVERYRRHRSVTGHEIEIEHARTDAADDIDADDVEAVIRELQEQYRDGVPLGVVAAAMYHRGVSLTETLDDIYDLRMGGGLYEPQDDHIAAV